MNCKLFVAILFIIFSKADAKNFLNEHTTFKSQYIIDEDICFDIKESTIDFVGSQLYFCENHVDYNYRRDSAVITVRELSHSEEVRLSYAIGEMERPGRVFSFACSDKYFVINKYDELLIFDRTQNNDLIYKDGLDFRCNNMKVSGENLLCYCTWVDLSAKSSTYFFKFSIKDGKFIERHFFDDPMGFYFYAAHPRHCYDIENSADLTHYIASPLRYSIDVYDKEYNKTTNISRKPKDWEFYPDSLKLVNLLDSTKIAYASSDMYKPFEYTDEISNHSSLIDKIFLMKEHLFVIWHMPSHDADKFFPKVFIDIWKRNNESQVFELKEKDISIMDNKSCHDISKLHMNTSVVFKDGYVLLCNNNPFPVNELGNISDSEFKKMEKSFYLENDLKTSIYLFEVNND